MNIVRELRKRKGIQQKELALLIGVSQPTVSDWESNKADPSGERLKKLAEYFGVDELVILGKNIIDLNQADAKKRSTAELSQLMRDVFIKYMMDQERETAPVRLVYEAMLRMPPEQQEKVVDILRAVFADHPEYFSDSGREG